MGFCFGWDKEIYFDVPSISQMLYGRFSFSNTPSGQQPYINVYGPGHEFLTGQANGSLHVEDPAPGQYRLTCDSWGVSATRYEIATGPDFFPLDKLRRNVVCRLWDNTFMLLVVDLPGYLPAERSFTEGLAQSDLHGGKSRVRLVGPR